MTDRVDNERDLLRKTRFFEGLASIRPEFGLILLKPDAQDDTLSNLLQMLKRHDLQIVADGGHVPLSRNDVFNLFLQGSDESYVEYMSSGYVRPLLVSGYDAIERLGWIKAELRLRLGLHRAELANIVHTSDEGIELERQTKHFFAEEVIFACADLAVNWHTSLECIADALIQRRVRVDWVGLVVSFEDLPSFRIALPRLDLGICSSLLGVRLASGSVIFPSPWKYEVFFQDLSEHDFRQNALSGGGLEVVSPSVTLTDAPLPQHYPELERLLEKLACDAARRVVARYAGGRVFALHTVCAEDDFATAEVKRRCATILAARPWGGTGDLTHEKWRTMSRGSLLRFLHAMPNL